MIDAETEGFRRRLQIIVDEHRSINAFGKASGIGQSTIRAYLVEGREPTRRNLITLADFAGVRLDWLLRGQPPMRETKSPGHPIPVYHLDKPAVRNRISSGIPDENLPITPDLLQRLACQREYTFGLQQHEDSMAWTIRADDLVLVNSKSVDLTVTGIYAVAINEALSLRRAIAGPRGPRLTHDNPEFSSQDMDVQVVEHLAVLGRVVWRAGQI